MAVLGRRRPGHVRRRVQGSANCDQAATLKLRRAILRRPYRHSVHATISSVIGIEVSQASARRTMRGVLEAPTRGVRIIKEDVGVQKPH